MKGIKRQHTDVAKGCDVLTAVRMALKDRLKSHEKVQFAVHVTRHFMVEANQEKNEVE